MKKIVFLFLFITACGSSQNFETKIVQIKNGDSINPVTTRLFNDGIIENKFSFRILAKISGKDSNLKIGTYQIPPSTSYNKILDIITSGKSLGIRVTIPEGFNIFQIVALLEDKKIVSAKEFLTEIYSNKWLQEFNLPTNNTYNISHIRRFSDKNGYKFAVPSNPPENSLEGYLFPDTYSFEQNMSANMIVKSMVHHFNSTINNKILSEIKKQNKTLHEVIILASIIQKEATDIKEMPKVAGVYHNRLKQNMILQADPTLIYALILDGEYSGNIKTKHLRPPWPSDYNTYYIKTLPKGAIANPGKQAILAAIYPAKHDYIFFVGNPDGHHTYSRTYKEHKKAVQEWINHRTGK